MNSREQFIRWVESLAVGYDLRFTEFSGGLGDGEFFDAEVQGLWTTWQASRACATPEWEHAPDWASWLAMNSDGRWYWFAKEPELRSTTWSNVWGSYVTEAGRTNGRSGWTETLEQRP